MPEILGSVLIPAHNEATVIGRCLDSLFAEFTEGDEIEVVVACNGCTDGTPEIVRATGYPVRVVEVSQASKVAALRIGEAELTKFPRIYLDADVILSSASARLVLDRLRTKNALAARPPLRYDTDRSSLPVRAYYRARVRIPSLVTALWGGGVYGLSHAGRSRFGEFPDVINDDFFVDQLFTRSEIEIVDTKPVVVVAPGNLKDLLAILRRVYRGNAENRSMVGGGESTTNSTTRELLKTALAGPRQTIDAVIYLAIAVSARILLKFSAAGSWERDDSSREV